MVGETTVVRTFCGPPAFWIASFRSAMVRALTRLALGWGLNTTVLPAATMLIALLRMLSVGFVLGVMAPITP